MGRVCPIPFCSVSTLYFFLVQKCPSGTTGSLRQGYGACYWREQDEWQCITVFESEPRAQVGGCRKHSLPFCPFAHISQVCRICFVVRLDFPFLSFPFLSFPFYIYTIYIFRLSIWLINCVSSFRVVAAEPKFKPIRLGIATSISRDGNCNLFPSFTLFLFLLIL